MNVLAVDTALGACSAAILSGEAVRAHAHAEMARGQAEALAPMVQAIIEQSGLAFAQIERLAVTTGPGTFTGQRVGLSFMRALALALGRPLSGVTTLAAMGAEALAQTDAAWAAVLSDAKRGEVYCAAYGRDARVLIEPELLPSTDVIAHLAPLAERHGSALALAGTAVPQWLAAAPMFSAVDSLVRQPNARFVARLAQAQAAPTAPPRPLYLRAPDAKLPPVRTAPRA